MSVSDYITIHVPLTDTNKGLINSENIKAMKNGAVLLNFARNGLVEKESLKKALAEGKISRYVTDFPEADLLHMENVIPLPHIGASTKEAEANSACMAVQQLKNFLECGNITNSVNFPECSMEMTGTTRIVITNKYISSMVGQITSVLADEKINISDMLNKHKGDYAYTLIDVDADIPQSTLEKIKNIEGVISVRLINAEC